MKAIEEALATLPSDLSETYKRILLGIFNAGEATANTARRILMWLVGSMRPLRLAELEEAIMIEPGSVGLNKSLRLFNTTGILVICGGLVGGFFDGYYGHCVRLSHYTVQVNANCL